MNAKLGVEMSSSADPAYVHQSMPLPGFTEATQASMAGSAVLRQCCSLYVRLEFCVCHHLATRPISVVLTVSCRSQVTCV